MAQDPNHAQRDWPILRTAGVDGFLISFADKLSEPANRAALAFRKTISDAGWAEVEETSTSLVSTFLRFDPISISHDTMQARITELLEQQDWFAAPLPSGRTLWRVPTMYEGAYAPQLEEAADLAKLDPDDFINTLSSTRVRVQTIGFAPGQPYLGELPEAFDIPRQTRLTKEVPAGALTVAIRQIVLFTNPSPTGWRQVGQTRLKLFRPEQKNPFVLRPGDDVIFERTTPRAFSKLKDDPTGGAESEPIK